MSAAIQVIPESPIEGAPITIVAEAAAELPTSVAVRRMSGKKSETFQVPLNPTGSGKSEGQFAIYEAGLYQIETGSVNLPLHVIEAKNIALLSELGLVSALVVAFSAGVIGWSRKKRNRR